MPQFKFVVIETIAHEKHYTVEADSREEALDLAHMGDTINEVFVKDRGVVDRVVCDEVTNG
jgi:hypothetical protein